MFTKHSAHLLENVGPIPGLIRRFIASAEAALCQVKQCNVLVEESLNLVIRLNTPLSAPTREEKHPSATSPDLMLAAMREYARMSHALAMLVESTVAEVEIEVANTIKSAAKASIEPCWQTLLWDNVAVCSAPESLPPDTQQIMGSIGRSTELLQELAEIAEMLSRSMRGLMQILFVDLARR